MKNVDVYYVTSSRGTHIETLSQSEAERAATMVYQDHGVIAEIHVNSRTPKDHTKS